MLLQVMEVLVGMKEERQEAVLTSGLDLWEMDGCPLVVGEVGRGEVARGETKVEGRVERRSEGRVGGAMSGRLSMEIHAD